MKILALDFGGSSVKYGVVDENAVITESGKLPAPLSSVEEFADTVAGLYDKFKDQVSGIGVSLPGNIDPESFSAAEFIKNFTERVSPISLKKSAE